METITLGVGWWEQVMYHPGLPGTVLVPRGKSYLPGIPSVLGKPEWLAALGVCVGRDLLLFFQDLKYLQRRCNEKAGPSDSTLCFLLGPSLKPCSPSPFFLWEKTFVRPWGQARMLGVGAGNMPTPLQQVLASFLPSSTPFSNQCVLINW